MLMEGCWADIKDFWREIFIKNPANEAIMIIAIIMSEMLIVILTPVVHVAVA